MAKRRLPEKSKIQRDRPLAYSRRSKTSGDDVDDEAATEELPATSEGRAKTLDEVAAAKIAASRDDDDDEDRAREPTVLTTEVPDIEPPPPKGEPWPDATPEPMRPIERRPTVTAQMSAVDLGEPPALPTTSSAAMPLPPYDKLVEDPTHMPGPREIPGGDPTDPALPPGRVPPGDSRSLRRANDFALVYRIQTCVISRFGVLGTRGQWRVVDYPTSAAAANAYAKECSRFAAEGFSDYRD